MCVAQGVGVRMKRHLAQMPCQRTLFWDYFFEYAGDIVLCDLATMRGTFRAEQRVMVPRIELSDHAGQTFMPNYIIRTVKDAHDVVFRFPERLPLCMEFSGVCPAHHVTRHPVFPTPKRELPFGLEDKPRERDREGVRMGACTWLGELIIDVDLDDTSYNRRNLCSCAGMKKCCDTCWALFMSPAMQVLEFLLRDVFEFKAYFFVFSGRRGFHCWIIDKQVVMWTIAQRKAFIEKVSRLYEDDTPIADAVYQMLEPIFDGFAPLQKRNANVAKRAAVFKELYPKFDCVVTSDTTHNHKLPLMIHPATGNVCVTIPNVSEFVPSRERYKQGDISEATMLRWLEPIVQALDVAYGEKEQEESDEEEESEKTRNARIRRECWEIPEL